MRELSLAKIQQITKKSDAAVLEVVKLYNAKPENSDRKAVKGGTRRPRCKDEEKVLSRFSLK
ncbi:hypothetical protein MKY84_01155 [Chryseomicrobium sp. FSL W7-1435]|uniref:hypothetical protein n=1 Tax=Chryseomicrobium sp. FSL W7-1435 TaxID=2921704 RepID=UPI003159C243